MYEFLLFFFTIRTCGNQGRGLFFDARVMKSALIQSGSLLRVMLQPRGVFALLSAEKSGRLVEREVR